jgi:hypothetical protein
MRSRFNLVVMADLQYGFEGAVAGGAASAVGDREKRRLEAT